ncbi:hypothetical protein LUZ60_016152 [Juncus effusus]|nr:hypothetical protein LUZ60_016152 [Juncus effusus]
MPKSKPNPPTRVPCLVSTLSHHISHNNLAQAVSSLPLFTNSGLRPPFHLLSALLRRCLLSESSSLHLARQLYLFLRVSRLYTSCTSSTRLATHLLNFHFVNGDVSEAEKLFVKMKNRNVYSYNVMLNGYSRLNKVDSVKELFDKMPYKDLCSWNTMIVASARKGEAFEAMDLYSRLRKSSFGFNQYTFTGLIIASIRILDPRLVKQIHQQVLILGFCLSNLVITSSLLDAYAKCGLICYAHRLFDEMPVRNILAWTSLIHGYSKLGDLKSAHKLFDGMPERNLITWNSLIGGYISSNQQLRVLDLIKSMVNNGLKLDHFILTSSLTACAGLRNLKHGKCLHSYLIKNNFSPNSVVISSLIDMYSKCGDLNSAKLVFDRTSPAKKDTVVWCTMMSALGQHGFGRNTLNLFDEMIQSGKKINLNVVLIVLNVCRNLGFLDKGIEIFRSMEAKLGFKDKHYVCAIDMMGQAGRINEAVELIGKMRNGLMGWHALFCACGINEDFFNFEKELEELLLD